MQNNYIKNTKDRENNMLFRRKDGKRDRSTDIFERIMPIIMKERNDALVYIKKEVVLDGMNEYIRKQKENNIDLTYMEIIFTALARVAKEKPKINRFIMSGEIYNRNNINISVVVKPKLEENVKESVAKFNFNGNEKTHEVSKMVKEEVFKIRNNDNNTTEDLVEKFKNIPTIFLKIAINTLMFLDKINLLPKSIIDASPFHSSIFVTNVGSIGLDTIYHHIYNFGTVRNIFIYW